MESPNGYADMGLLSPMFLEILGLRRDGAGNFYPNPRRNGPHGHNLEDPITQPKSAPYGNRKPVPHVWRESCDSKFGSGLYDATHRPSSNLM